MELKHMLLAGGGSLAIAALIAVGASAASDNNTPTTDTTAPPAAVSSTTTPGSGESAADTTVPPTQDLDNSGTDEEELRQIAEAITVNPADTPNNCPELAQAHGGTLTVWNGVTYVNLYPRSVLGTPPRAESDSVSTPYIQTEPAPMKEETQANVCMDPNFGVMVANGFANLTLPDGTRVTDLNPWLAPYAGDPEKIINVKAKEFMPALGVDNPSNELANLALQKNLEWQAVASSLNYLISRLEPTGIRAERAVLSYHLVLDGNMTAPDPNQPQDWTLPIVGFDPLPDAKPALMLEYTLKNGCPMWVIGFNTGDKRWEQFAAPSCAAPPKPPAPPVTTPTTVKPKPPSSPTTTVKPTTTVPKSTTTVHTTTSTSPSTTIATTTTAHVTTTTAHVTTTTSATTTVPMTTTTVPKTTTTAATTTVPKTTTTSPVTTKGPPHPTTPGPSTTYPTTTVAQSTTSTGHGSGWGGNPSSSVSPPTTVTPSPTYPNTTYNSGNVTSG